MLDDFSFTRGSGVRDGLRELLREMEIYEVIKTSTPQMHFTEKRKRLNLSV